MEGHHRLLRIPTTAALAAALLLAGPQPASAQGEAVPGAITSETSFDMIKGRNYDEQYVTSGSKKYFVLRDSEKVPLAPQVSPQGYLRVALAPSASWTWWAKYPAPPPEVTSVTYFTSLAPPFEDVPIRDK